VLTTFHAGSAAEAVSRLADMDLESYLLKSGILGIVAQRLVRRLCDCAAWTDDPDARLGLPVERVRVPNGCPQCGGSGYRDRFVLAEMLVPHRRLNQHGDASGRGILSHMETSQIEQAAIAGGMVPVWQRACDAVAAGLTSPAEVRRVYGFRRVLNEKESGDKSPHSTTA
jgi:type II secretory ATPase GspE/PulE/Tfp pilus assembly ATPase PilB-like protein